MPLQLREINCSVLGDENEAMASECEEPLHSKDILSYEDKYLSNSKMEAQKEWLACQERYPHSLKLKKKRNSRYGSEGI